MGGAHYLPQPPLPEVSGRGGKTMAGRTRGGAAGGSLLSRRLHPAGGDRRHRVPEQGRRLRPPVPDRRRNADHHRRRPEASGRPHRPHRRPPHLGSALTHHPHVHVIVPGGGPSPDGSRWITCKPGFFLPVRVLSRLFRRLFLEGLADLNSAGRLVFFEGLAPLRIDTSSPPSLIYLTYCLNSKFLWTGWLRARGGS